MEDQFVASERFVRISTRGRTSGERRDVTVGFADDPRGLPGAVVAAAGDTDADWAMNLLAEPACAATIGGRSFVATAEPLAGADHAAAIRALILRYGTPAERLGRGPSFRLIPVPQAGPG